MMKKHTVMQLSPAFLFDSCKKFPDLVGIVGTRNSLSSLQVVNHQYTLTIPEYRHHYFAGRDNLRNLTSDGKWRASIAYSAAWSPDQNDGPESRP